MKQVFLLLNFFFLIFTSSFSQDIIQIYDPHAVKREVGEFHQLVISGPFSIMLKQGAEAGLAVSSENKDLSDAVQANVQDGILRIKFDKGKKKGIRLRSNVILYISVTNIDSISLSGAGSMVMDGRLAVSSLGISLSGASDINGEIQVDRLNIHQSGASDIKLKGIATTAHIQLSGASDLRAGELESSNCYAIVSGASNMKINVNQYLDAKVSGASDLRYSGNPAFKYVKTTGASTVKQINK